MLPWQIGFSVSSIIYTVPVRFVMASKGEFCSPGGWLRLTSKVLREFNIRESPFNMTRGGGGEEDIGNSKLEILAGPLTSSSFFRSPPSFGFEV